MYQLTINSLSEQEFLNQYWQKKPLLIKQGFRDFEDPLDANELAGLAMEESIESRIITNQNNDWQAHHGPFEDFELLTEQHSTLLVQAVDHWHPDAAQILEPFRFIPNWRIDDLMISYSTPGGGVGPHLDQYDVFIIQGEGKRHWRVGMPDSNLKQFAQNKSLLQVEQFPAVIDCILEPGDILYIPPGCPHEGYAVENAINYSVGFRAPNQQDLLSSFADYVIDKEAGSTRYSDPLLETRESKGLLSTTEATEVKQLLSALLQDDSLFKSWLGQTTSEPKHEMDLMPPEDLYTTEQVAQLIGDSDEIFERLGGTRAIYQSTDNEIILSVNGQNFLLPKTDLAVVKLLTDDVSVTAEQIKSSKNSLKFTQSFTTLLNEGIWFC
ncbi:MULTISPECIES: cupin domain-containing protein [unclassified Pseudoalteromonas]|uniref:ribosomal protein uL16 3-hydroxylase n=1 Tax=unclassified Pseudoalteromonas TaxID=194690 RepID=UPI000C08856E|nr:MULTISPECIES: cupin domain-containing protein [unclassified Pseudoalteromonas]MDP2635750.1 cupin domain-containing protein [Pseudoalteromonas sp. 1_MG-2023]PHN91302.1 50S ribosomal protein L16 arginine hydroxylase [Pseudoalteromonas sp. 3D05]